MVIISIMPATDDIITIDGSAGEGGGQILRTALGLSMVTGRAFRIEKIRARRPKPGLARQHLVAVSAAATICQAEVTGASLGSQELVFRPGRVCPGKYSFDIGTAGSTSLVIQTILPAILMVPGRWEIELIGGTHNPLAPPVDYLQKTFLPILKRMGAQVEVELLRPGFYPAGGGRVVLRGRGCETLRPVELLERGALRRRLAWAAVANLPPHIAQREVDTLCQLLGFAPAETAIRRWEAFGPGNVVAVELEFENITELFCNFGERGKPAEKVAEELAREVRRYLATEAPVGEHLADQILIPLALAGEGRFRTLSLSSHAQTNIEIINKFLYISCEVIPVGEDTYEVRLSREGSLQDPATC
ncbi:MAG: RNA 3'-terminal phosphate cyclase [Thermoguttaceae bacterium]|nr:RNA 3'-terminal phosphate cyclase [Thermoguttaceae bacterium]MDW8079985.1 RNA 3'-terminal phosphate cyclase [Thermoguttaceae bacterium]